MRRRRKVTRNHQVIFRPASTTYERDYRVLPIMKIDPLESPVLEIDLIQGGFAPIQLVQLLTEGLEFTMNLVVEQPPFHLALIIPFRSLTNLASHKQQLLTRVPVHIAQ